MDSVQKALETQVKNIQAKTGKSLAELAALAKASGLSKHGEIRDMFKTKLGLGHGDANTLTHAVLKPGGEPEAEGGDVLAEIYAGPKAGLRPIHEKLMAELQGWGEFEVAPKKGYVSLRRKKQFAMVGPATKTQVEVGLNIKDLAGGGRLVALAPGGMCQYKVRLSSVAEVDAELMGWVRAAFEAAG
ncbi:MAG: DUF4287 domain-containing protein [Acidobacteria bacterium]|nr:DUF4287 domain-containing protein [Acidobacteriota bacterium]